MSAKGHVMRGLFHRNQREFPLAIEEFGQAIQLNPRFADAYFHRGIVFNWLVQPTEALRDLDRLIRIFPQYADAYLQRGLV